MLNNSENTGLTVPSSNPIYTCGRGKFAKLTELNYTQWEADVTAIFIAEDTLEIVEGHEDVPVANQRAAAADYRC
jgi:hypothetical protein